MFPCFLERPSKVSAQHISPTAEESSAKKAAAPPSQAELQWRDEEICPKPSRAAKGTLRNQALHLVKRFKELVR